MIPIGVILCLELIGRFFDSVVVVIVIDQLILFEVVGYNKTLG
jgi:hypothetical protein